MSSPGRGKLKASFLRAASLALLAIWGGGELPALAQQNITSATVSGRVEDANGDALSGFQLSYIFQYGSPLPFNVVTGTDRNNDTNVNDRPAGLGRNTGRGFNFASLDLRLSRRFDFGERVRLEAIVEGFNVLNRANLQLPNSTLNPSNPASLRSFGQPTAADNPRQVQFGLRLNFGR